MSEKEEEKRERYAVYLSKLKIRNYRNFQGIHEFDLTDGKGQFAQWTVFLGNNNCGKTNLLKAIAGMNPGVTYNGPELVYFPIGAMPEYQIQWIPSETPTSKLPAPPIRSQFLYSSLTLKSANPQFARFPVDIDKSGISATWGYGHSRFDSHQQAFLRDLFIYAYGVSRRTSGTGLSQESNSGPADSLFFPGVSLINLEDWLLQIDYARKNNQPQGHKALEKIRELIQSDVFPDIEDFKTESLSQLVNRVLFKTHDGWHTFSELGYGYQTSLAWLIDFCRKMFLRYPDSPNPWAEPAICLVDEIDLHLHPTWQRTIIRDLSKMFPATQFIVTTHSPLVIQSMENINLYVLTREKDGVKVTHAPKRTYFGWTVEEILTELMENPEGGYSDRYLRLMQEFNTALRKGDKRKAQEVFDLLASELHPASADKTIMKLQLSQLTGDDQTDERRTAS